MANEIILDGKTYWRGARGELMPIETIRPMDKLYDQAVEKIHGYAKELSERIARFKAHTMEDICALQDLLAEQYGVQAGGRKGNLTLTSYDGLKRVVLSVQDTVEFGPELQTAKNLFDDCLRTFAADASPEVRMLLTKAFQVDQKGRINRSEIFRLMRAQIEDVNWQKAIQAVRDSIFVQSSKSYLQFQIRDSLDDPWRNIPIDLAAVKAQKAEIDDG